MQRTQSLVKRLVEQTFLDMYQHRNSEINKTGGLNRMESNEENKQAAAASEGNQNQNSGQDDESRGREAMMQQQAEKYEIMLNQCLI